MSLHRQGEEPWRRARGHRGPMLSPLDMLVIGGAALIFFGPDQLPSVARKVGSVVRELQMTSQSFIREMERAADDAEAAEAARRMTSQSETVEGLPVDLEASTPLIEPGTDGQISPGSRPDVPPDGELKTPPIGELKD